MAIIIGSTTKYTNYVPLPGIVTIDSNNSSAAKLYGPPIQNTNTANIYVTYFEITFRYLGPVDIDYGYEVRNTINGTWFPVLVNRYTDPVGTSSSSLTRSVGITTVLAPGATIRFFMNYHSNEVTNPNDADHPYHSITRFANPDAGTTGVLYIGQNAYMGTSNGTTSGTWSAFLRGDTVPTATVISPVNNQVVQDAHPTLSFSFNKPAGATNYAYRVTVIKDGVTLIGDTDIQAMNSAQMANGRVDLQYNQSNFSNSFSELVDSSTSVYTWTATVYSDFSGSHQIAGNGDSGSFKYSLSGHVPTVTLIIQQNNATLEPDLSTVNTDALGHTITNVKWTLNGASTLDSTQNNATYPNDFVIGVAQPLEYGHTYTGNVAVTCSAGYTANKNFTIVYPAHNPTVTIISPKSTISSYEPTFLAQYLDNLGHSIDNIQIQVYKGADKIGDTGETNGSASISKKYSIDNFIIQYTALEFGQSYIWKIRVQDNKGVWSPYISQDFAVAPYAPTATINAPNSGGFDLTPQLVGLADDPLGFARQETEWTMFDTNNTMLGKTIVGLNNLSLNYDGSPTNWASYTPLDYGHTYTVKLRVRSSANVWSNLATRTFSIAEYTPTVALTAPSGSKIDTLQPLLTGTYFSQVGTAKQDHAFAIYDASGTALQGYKLVTGNASSPFSENYVNDGSWVPYNALQYETQYTFVAMAKDANGIWSASGVGAPNRKLIKTDSYPLAPTNLVPDGETVATLQPTLNASFNDPDAGDTPSVMEVELRQSNNGTLILQRTEADNDTLFSVFLADGLQVDVSYMWRARFKDQAGLQGPWSQWATFSTKQGALVAFTLPAEGEILDSPQQTFTWTYTHPNGVPQATGRLRIYSGNDTTRTIYDSGIVAGAYTSQLLPITLLNNNSNYRARVDVTDNNGDSAGTGIIAFSTAWEGPPQPNNVTATPNNADASVSLTWDETDTANFNSYRVYKKDTKNDTDWVLVDEIFDVAQTTYVYYFAASGRVFQYAVTVVSTETGVALESGIDTFAAATLDFSTETWLNDSLNPQDFRLRLQRNPTRSSSFSRDSVYTQAIGRKFPALHIGRAYSSSVDTTFQVSLPYVDVDMLEDIIERGNNVLYRDGRGRREWVAVTSYKLDDTRPNKGTLSLQVTVVSVKDR